MISTTRPTETTQHGGATDTEHESDAAPPSADVPVLESTIEDLKHTIAVMRRSHREFQLVTESQLRRLQEKNFQKKQELKKAKDREHLTAHALADAVLNRMILQSLTAAESSFCCDICFDIFHAPDMVTSCGHSFCQDCILQVIRGKDYCFNFQETYTPAIVSLHPSCPSCRQPITQTPVHNYKLECAVQALVKGGFFKRETATVDRDPHAYVRFFKSIPVDPAHPPDATWATDDDDVAWDMDGWA
ncbi:hypothetical protein B0H16DRAFT_1725301 [Mycena metata]|uniref:RING-type domain-containing protein n=1 Tax=Mycena metata TaxID=1033252 RepID=A0AAD7IRR0_9AGAR|nr:hypothetical protein B0H16DRAFT_1725301 [Mycena metata]